MYGFRFDGVGRGRPWNPAGGMKNHVLSTLRCWFLAISFCTLAFSGDVATSQYDTSRTGSNSSEIYLSTSNVNSNTFGKLFTRAVDSNIMAQPLYLQGVTFSSGTHNVVYVGTMNNTVYAFDADNPASSSPLWSTNLGAPDTTANQWGNLHGIVGTPVIDRALQAIYVVAANTVSGQCVYSLHALDLLSGVEKFGGPAAISGSVSGSAFDGSGGTVTFNGTQQIQRAGLGISGGSVYIGFSGEFADSEPYHGWVFGYSLGTLRQTAVYMSTPNGQGAGVWQGSRAPVIDANGVLYYETGNGDYDGAVNFGESFIKMTPNSSGALTLSDWFTPYNWATLNEYDWDLGSSGPTLIPGSNRIVGGGKTGILYSLNTGSLGHNNPSGDTQIPQSFLATAGCTPPYSWHACSQIMSQAFSYAAAVPTLYVWGVYDKLRAYQFVNGAFNTTAASVGAASAYFPGGSVSHSSYLATSGTGIVWAVVNDVNDGGNYFFTPVHYGAASLHAYDASNLTNELWNSDQKSGDALGNLPGFSGAIVANGKVYVPTFSNQLVVYGLLNGPVMGDVNADSVVNCADLDIIKAAYGKTSSQPGFDLRADVVPDGVINARDLALVAQHVPPGTVCQ